jgi:hypothetical protein
MEKTPDDLTVEQFYTSLDGKVWPEETWITEDGRKILVRDLEPEHARNIIRMILRNERIQTAEYNQMIAALEMIFAQSEREETGRLLN